MPSPWTRTGRARRPSLFRTRAPLLRHCGCRLPTSCTWRTEGQCIPSTACPCSRPVRMPTNRKSTTINSRRTKPWISSWRSQLWDAGESVAELQNSGVKIDNLRAVRIPASYNVQLDPSSASVLLAPDSAALVTIVNADPMDYRFSWELLTRGKISRDPDRPAVTVPANGSALINLSRAAPRVSWVAAGTLKDDVADSTLVLHPAIEAQDGIPPQAPKMLPFKLRLSFWSAVPQQVSEFFWTMLLLLAGALASMAARYFIPNAVGALKLRRQLDQLDGKVAGMSDNVSSKWQVLLAHNLETCRAGLHDFPWAFPAFATRLADLQVQTDMFSQWVNTAYGVGSALDQVSPLLQNGRMPPTVLDLVEQSCQAALQPIESGMTNADELQGMKTALKTAQDLIAAVRTSVPIPTLDGKIQEREKRLQEIGRASCRERV